MSLTIQTKDLKYFLTGIIGEWPTYGPTADKLATNARFRFAKLASSKEYVMRYGATVVPPKKYLFPAKEDVFRFEKGEILPPTNKDFVVFGVNKRDGEGLFYLDQIFTTPVADTRYAEKRKHMHLVIVDPMPPSNNLNCDLYLQITDEKHLAAYPYTEFGENLVRGNKYFGHVDEVGSISGRHMPDDVLYHPRLAEIIENSREHPVWKKLTETCFACGVCSYVCPLCYCYEERDRVSVTADVAVEMKGATERRWDSCMLPDFAAVSFKNFRPEVKDRIYNWYYHKFVRMPEEYGFPGCIDCGRCITYCAAKINYREVLKELIADDKRRK
jgi:sulfhydrogenase subunit beta (sulfur reductase)